MPKLTDIRKSASIALRALQRNKLQTTLTMVGMTIGVATVLTMVALGTGAQHAIQDQVRAAGMNVFVVSAGNYKMQQQWTSQGEAEEPSAYHPDKFHPRLRTLEWVPLSPGISTEKIFQPQDNPIQRLERGGENAAGNGAADTLSIEDATAIAAMRGVQNVSAGVRGNAVAKAGSTTWFTHVHGESESYASIRRIWVFPKGKFYGSSDVKNAAKIAVLGSIVSRKLFGAADPVGQIIEIRGIKLKIIAVVGSGSWMVPAVEDDDQFDAIYMPVTTAQEVFNRKSMDTLTVATESTGDVVRMTKAVTSLLRERHHLPPEAPSDFTVVSQAHKSLARGGMRTDIARAVVGNVNNLDKVTLEQLGKTLDRASRTMTALLASIATVSLIVGGIGIMNIMLLSVTERTKEIGIRRAVGARSEDVMLQFLLEAVTLSIAGGITGVIAGLVASGFIARFIQWSTSISLYAIGISFGISAFVGILFGYYPAREASKVSPMTSLRFE